MTEKRYRRIRFNLDGTVAGEWSLAGWDTWVRFDRAHLDLLWIELAADSSPDVARALWALQDGYGEPGTTPVQGWDWFGIRDSSTEAKARMLVVAVFHLPWPELLARLGVTQQVDA